MKPTLFKNLLAFSVSGIALGFFGMLYEGVVVLPAMLEPAPERMLFWNHFYSIINPVVYYIPVVPLATIILLFLYLKTYGSRPEVKWKLGGASFCQLIALLLTVYLIKGIDLRMHFNNIEKYSAVIPRKTLLANILSGIRLVFSGMSLWLTAGTFFNLKK
jgi:hypothetical protein